MEMFCLGLDLESVLITFVILVGVLLGKRNAMNEYFPALLLVNALGLLADMGTIVFANIVGMLLIYKIFIIAQCAFIFCGIVGVNLYVDAMIGFSVTRKSKFMRFFPFLLSAIAIIVWILSMVTGWCYSISESGELRYGPYFIVVQILGLVTAILPLLRIITNHILDEIESNYAKAMYVFIAVPLGSLTIAQIIKSVSVVLAAMTVSYAVMFIFVHVQASQNLLEDEADSEKRQTKLVVSQIQPHFIINTLTTIKYLCKTNPVLAMEAVGKFSKYIRTNIDTIDNDNLVKFSEELEHTKTYLWLEQLRFGKEIRTQYSIDTDDFLIPPLSIQPIVENAVKHGITKKIGGGTVTIAVRETDRCYKITVSDDGVGYEHQKVEEHEQARLGINDVRQRIMKIKGSTLTVSSRVGVGTSAVYEIMKEEK